MYYRESNEGVDPIWEYCRQLQHNRLKRRVRIRQLRFIIAISIAGVIITLAATWK